jgi:hypothetical protein
MTKIETSGYKMYKSIIKFCLVERDNQGASWDPSVKVLGLLAQRKTLILTPTLTVILKTRPHHSQALKGDLLCFFDFYDL